MRGLESFVGRAVLVHADSEVIPGFRISVRWSSESHPCESGGYPSVEPSAEFDHDCFRVGVPRVVNQVPELVQVVVDRPLPLEVRRCLERVDRGCFGIERGEVLSEFFLEVRPVDKSEPTSFARCFSFEFPRRPAASSSGLHVGHGPDDFRGFVIERFRA